MAVSQQVHARSVIKRLPDSSNIVTPVLYKGLGLRGVVASAAGDFLPVLLCLLRRSGSQLPVDMLFRLQPMQK